jgi:enoyl-CoA hydratase
MSDAVKIERVLNKLVVRFSKPAVRNPLSMSVIDELRLTLDEVASERELTTIIFTGSGNVFASGADLREIAQLSRENAAYFAANGQRLMTQIEKLSISAVAAIKGPCFGGALDLALACKRRLVSPDAMFSHPGVGLGIITGWGGTQRLPRLIGEAAAMEMLLTAGKFDAEWALNRGLVDKVIDDPLAEALGLDQI